MEFSNKISENSAEPACEAWEALLPEAVEDLLSDAEAKALERHLASCAGCSAELSEARRGAAWLSLLKSQSPEPPQDIVAAILARTSGAPTLADALTQEWLPRPVAAFSAVQPGLLATAIAAREDQAAVAKGWLLRWLGLDRRLFPSLQPRLTMTAAMAFFSVCLTLNMLGISVTRLHAEDLHATGGLQRTVAGKRATLLRSFEGIRVVYRVESRVSNWLTASAGRDAPRPQQ